VNILGNLVAFMPLGLIVPIVFKRKETYYFFHIVVLWAFIISLSIEIAQLVMSVGSFDVDDLILNTFGAMIGYWIYIYARRWYRKSITTRTTKTTKTTKRSTPSRDKRKKG